MKIQLYKKSFLYLVPVYSLIVLLTACQNSTKDIPGSKKKITESDKNYTDFNGAMAYEFNMLKNPATGKIPAGIRDAELEQARALLGQQELNGIVAVNPYTYQGPDNLGGRTRALAYDVRNGTGNAVIMAGGVSGGLYKSSDDGATWVRKSPLGELFTVTALAQDTRSGGPGGGVFYRDTWYYAGGEFSGNSASATGAFYRGKGVYKSTDNGETWTFLPASNTGVLEVFDNPADYVSKLVVDPTNGNVYMAATDGILRSTDGGTTWSFVLTSTSGSLSSTYVTDIIVTATGRF
jgi:hypothetical protein